MMGLGCGGGQLHRAILMKISKLQTDAVDPTGVCEPKLSLPGTMQEII